MFCPTWNIISQAVLSESVFWVKPSRWRQREGSSIPWMRQFEITAVVFSTAPSLGFLARHWAEGENRQFYSLCHSSWRSQRPSGLLNWRIPSLQKHLTAAKWLCVPRPLKRTPASFRWSSVLEGLSRSVTDGRQLDEKSVQLLCVYQRTLLQHFLKTTKANKHTKSMVHI